MAKSKPPLSGREICPENGVQYTSAENLGLVEGKVAYAVVKASNVMVAVD
jgi:molybdopterin-binding protein